MWPCTARRRSTASPCCPSCPFDEVAPGLIGDDGDVQARFLEALVSTKGGVLRVVSLYLPNGNPPTTDKYTYKINWMDRLHRFARERLKLEEPMVLCRRLQCHTDRRRRAPAGSMGE